MKLNRTTPAQPFKIKKPIWGGRMVGLNKAKVGTHNEIHILYEDANGDRLYPQPLYISGEKVRQYQAKPLKKYPNVYLYWIPINDLEPLERI